MALNKRSGRVLWSHDLVKDFGAPPPGRGYSCSPIAYRNTILVTAGGRGQAVMAFDQSDGHVVWKNQSFATAHAMTTHGCLHIGRAGILYAIQALDAARAGASRLTAAGRSLTLE